MSTSKTVRVTLVRPHTHAGEKYPAGKSISVPAADAEWLRQVGAAHDIKPKAVHPTKPSKGVKDE
ncbi:MAG: hypothetical protein WA924_07495 [Burkholderiaceae bacterium]